MIKFASDLLQVSGFLWVFRFPLSIKLTTITEILLKVALNTIKYNFQIRFVNCSDSVVFFVFHFILGMTIFLSLCHLTFEGKGYGA